MPYTPPEIPSGWVRINVGELVGEDAMYDAGGFGEFRAANDYITHRVKANNVAFITRIKITPGGNVYDDTL